MNRYIHFILLFALLLALACVCTATAETMYVNTKDGDSLNVREKPFISPETLIGSIKNHDPVEVISIDSNGWAKIKYQTGNGRIIDAYVSCRYLSYDKDGFYRDEKSLLPVPTAIPKQTNNSSFDDLKAELQSAKTLSQSFTVLVRPSRATGRVNLRWAPVNKARSIVTYPSNKKLIVIGETNNWYQAQDPEKGYVGFISKKLVTVVPAGLEE